MIFNKALFEYEMKVRDISMDDMCSALNLSRSAFYRKRNGLSEFTQSELQTIGHLIGQDAVIRVFFAPEVS